MNVHILCMEACCLMQANTKCQFLSMLSPSKRTQYLTCATPQLIRKPRRLTFLHRNPVRCTGFKFVSAGIEFGHTNSNPVRPNSNPAETNSNPALKTKS